MCAATTVALVGTGGYGRTHLARLRTLEQSERIRLVGTVDLDQAPPSALPHFRTLDQCLKHTNPGIVVIATPLPWHVEQTLQALAAGCHVYLEKPPATSWQGYQQIVQAARAAGRAVQVGFQALGSRALPWMRALLNDGELGPVRHVAATATWSRPMSYWTRAAWAGKRRLDDHEVVDGVLTNPLSHAIAQALAIVGATTGGDIAGIELEQFRANAIDCDDTSYLRIHTRQGIDIVGALTLCADREHDPRVSVVADGGIARLWYTRDEVRLQRREWMTRAETGEESAQTVPADQARHYGRTDLMANLLAHIHTGVPLLAPLRDVGGYMRVLEAVRQAPPVQQIRESVAVRSEAGERRVVLSGIEQAVAITERTGASLREQRLPWAAVPVLATIDLGGGRAEYRSGMPAARESSRPHIAAATTLAGAPMTACRPADHEWHHGISLAFHNVAGVNFWGGGTYVPGHGYLDRCDHGRIDHERILDAGTDHMVTELRWRDQLGQVMLTEHRELHWKMASTRAWRLRWHSTLRPLRKVTIHSPGSLGLAGSGYGGIFWRLPEIREARIATSSGADDETRAMGSRAEWVAISGFSASRPVTAIGAGAIAQMDGDGPVPPPWFVRLSDYPGFGPAPCWDQPIRLGLDQQLDLGLTCYLSDGVLDSRQISALVSPDLE